MRQIVITALFTIVIAYLSVSFIEFDFNPHNWDKIERVLVVLWTSGVIYWSVKNAMNAKEVNGSEYRGVDYISDKEREIKEETIYD